MTQRVFSEQEIMSDHPYAKAHEVHGHRLHGGFDADGNYISPRTLVREPAVDTWADALRERGGDILAVDPVVQDLPRFPNYAQMKLLLREGIEKPLWNSLTIISILEGRGRFIGEQPWPDLQQIIVEDVSEMGLGHLRKGLLLAHGLDEGGEPDKGIGAHDVMWIAVRDLAFGPRDYATPDAAFGNVDRERLVPEIAEPYEGMIRFMMTLLMIEYAAAATFDFNQRLLRDVDLFTDRRTQAEEAAKIVDRICQDEEIHVSSLRTFLGELASATVKTLEGGTIAGREVIDRLWAEQMRQTTVEQPKLRREREESELRKHIRAHPDAARIEAEFDALA
ncbi:MAG: hypothetical protein JRG82_08365 [Deltaproteobacteria bacterium]|nr:hypothetical protein [Deltaproteobacteria bacterium]